MFAKLSKRFLTFVIIVEAFVGGLAILFIAWALWNTPLSPSLDLPAVVNAQVDSMATPTEVNSHEVVAALEPTATATATPGTFLGRFANLLNPPTKVPSPTPVKTFCDAPPVMTLLVIGSDQRGTSYQYGLADSMRLVRVDFSEANANVMVLDLPRDLWVEIPGLEKEGITHGKLNQAYLFGAPGLDYYDGPGEGPGLLARTLQLNYGYQGIDHYLTMDMHTFTNFIDTIGGIDIYLGNEVDLNDGQDGANPDYVLEAGSHHLDGEMALKLARDRHPTIFQRARFQNVVLEGIRYKLLSPGIIPDLPDLFAQFKDSVRTDLSAREINQLICIGQKLDDEHTHYVAFPDATFTGESTYDPYRKVNTYTLGVDNKLMRSYFADFMKGTWPDE